jgi:phosphatidylglycerophosphatase C
MNLALFDFDGTITVGDTFSPFLRFAVRPSRVLLGGFLVAPFVVAYRLGLISAARARPVVARVSFQGEQSNAVRALGRRYATDVLPTSLRPEALDRLQWHRQQRDTVVVVSASLDVYLAPWCDAMGVEYICTELEEHNGSLTGRYRQGDCSGRAKALRVRERYDLSRYSVIYAYGDTSDDREMLDLAHRKYYRGVEVESAP